VNVSIKLWGAEADASGPAGKVLSADAQHGIVVACGTALRLTRCKNRAASACLRPSSSRASRSKA
jgi:hypothetical protein